jgi:hypothetical protein
MTPSTSRTIGLIILGGCLFVACYLAYHDLYLDKERALSQNENTGILTKPIDGHLRASHSIALMEIETRMETIHGHSDHDGLESDFRRGVLASDLLKRNCTRCGKPRNQRGDFVL